MENLYKQLKDTVDYVEALNAPYNDTQVASLAYNSINSLCPKIDLETFEFTA